MNSPNAKRAVTAAGQWIPKLIYSLADQGVLSGSNFALTLVLARLLAPSEYGAYAVAFSFFYLVAAVHSGIVLEPLMVFGPGRHGAHIAGYQRRVLQLDLGLAPLFALPFLAYGAFTTDASLRLALWILSVVQAAILVFWTIRRSRYAVFDPAGALAASIAYAGSLAVSTFVLWRADALTLGTALVSTAGASLVGAAVSHGRGSAQVRRSSVETPTLRGIVLEHWEFGRFLVIAALLWTGASQVPTLLTGLWLGLDAAGAFAAMTNLILPMFQLVIASTAIALPVVARLVSRGDATRTLAATVLFGGGLVSLALIYAAALVVLTPTIDRAVYGGRYREYVSSASVLGAAPVFYAVAIAMSVWLRANGHTRTYMIAVIAASTAALLVTGLLIRSLGLPGAFMSVVAAQGLLAASLVAAFAVESRWWTSRPNHV